MKNRFCIILVYAFLMTFYSVTAQESKSSLVISGSLMHFEGKQNRLVANDVIGITDYYSFPLNPGLGVFYQYQVYKKDYLLLGIKYQIYHLASTEDAIQRFRYSEPSISAYLKHYFHKNEKVGLFSALGLSYGKMNLSASESYGHITWSDFETQYLQNYSNNDSFIDLVFNTGVSFNSNHMEIAPEIGYRLKDNWMSFYRRRFFYGLIINYQLKFSKK